MNNTEPTSKFRNLGVLFSGDKKADISESAPTATPQPISNSENEVIRVPISQTVPFFNHTFDCTEEDIDEAFLYSIKENGVQTPALTRLNSDNKYEIISGHKRRLASIMSGHDGIPVIVRELTDEDAVIAMADSNKQRPTTKNSERARTLHAKYNALKKKSGERTDLNDTDNAGETTYQIMGKAENMSDSTVRRWIDCGKLPLDLLRFMDTGNYTYSTGSMLSYLPDDTTEILTVYLQNNPKTKLQGNHAELLKNLSEITSDSVSQIFMAEQEKIIKAVSIPKSTLESIFNEDELKTMDNNELLEYILKAVEYYREKGA